MPSVVSEFVSNEPLTPNQPSKGVANLRVKVPPMMLENTIIWTVGMGSSAFVEISCTVCDIMLGGDTAKVR